MTAGPMLDQGIVTVARRRLGRRAQRIALVLAAALAVAIALAMYLGDFPVAPGDILQALASPVTGIKTPGADFIVLNVRLPRVVLAVLSGAAFAMAGTIFQTLLRNPLASPDIIGISSGASAAAVFCIIVMGWSGALLSAGAVVGASLAALTIHVLAWRDGLSPFRVVLIGIAVAAIFGAATSYLFTRARIFEVQQAMGWLIGSLNAATMAKSVPLGLSMLVLVPAALVLARSLGLLSLGDDAARGLGLRVEAVRLILLFIAVTLSAVATAAVGPVPFVAFVSGPIARRLIGDGRPTLVASMLIGALVMTASDLVAQHALPSTQLPVGVVTGLLGATFLLWLLAGANRNGRTA